MKLSACWQTVYGNNDIANLHPSLERDRYGSRQQAAREGGEQRMRRIRHGHSQHERGIGKEKNKWEKAVTKADGSETTYRNTCCPQGKDVYARTALIILQPDSKALAV